MTWIFWKDLQPDNDTAKDCISLLKKKMANKITEEEFEKKLAYIIIKPECLQDYEYQETPKKTIEVQKALESLESERKCLRENECIDTQAFLKANPCLLDYSNKTESIARKNKRNVQEICRLSSYFTKIGDQSARLAVDRVFSTYPKSIWIENRMIWKKEK